MAAFVPVPPVSIVDSSMVLRVCAVDGFTTWTPAGCLVTTVAPSGLVTELTMRGEMRTPLFAIVWYMPAICRTVIETPCPNDTFANVEADQSDEPGTGT